MASRPLLGVQRRGRMQARALLATAVMRSPVHSRNFRAWPPPGIRTAGSSAPPPQLEAERAADSAGRTQPPRRLCSILPPSSAGPGLGSPSSTQCLGWTGSPLNPREWPGLSLMCQLSGPGAAPLGLLLIPKVHFCLPDRSFVICPHSHSLRPQRLWLQVWSDYGSPGCL